MPITRLNHFEAAPGRSADLRRFLEGVIDTIKNASGCIACELLQSLDDPGTLAVVEVWDSVEAHRAAAKAIPPSMLQDAMTLMGAPPSGAYYQTVSGSTLT